jgi:hypothetical protein
VSLSGLIEQVSVVELLQFVHLGHRSGTLHLRDGARVASVSVHRGRTVGATSPDSLALGPLLVERKLASRAQLAEAERRQAAARPRPRLDTVLIELKVVTAAALLGAVEEQIKTCIYDIMTWTTGSFDFDVGRVELLEDLSPAPGEPVPPLDINTQGALLEGLQRADERAHEAASNEAAPDAPRDVSRAGAEADARRARDARPTSPVRVIGAEAAWRTSVFQLVTRDVELARQVGARLAAERVRCVRVALADAGAAGPDEGPPIVLLDLRAQAATLADLRNVRRLRPRALVLAVPGSDLASAQVYAAGATAVVAPDAEVVATCAVSLYASLRDTDAEAALERGLSEGFGKVRALLNELRAGGVRSTTLSLNLMAVVSESVERAVLFLARKSDLKATGAFGRAGDGRPLAEATRDLTLADARTRTLVESLADGRTRRLEYDEDALPAALAQILEPPRTGEAALFPVLGGQGLLALLYADNGASARALVRLESIEIATAQVGLAFENQLLRRQLGARTPGGGLHELVR